MYTIYEVKNCTALKKTQNRNIQIRTKIQTTEHKIQNTQYEARIQRTKYEAIALRLNPGDRCAPVCWHGFHELGIKTGKQANSEIQIEGHGNIQIEKYTSTEIQEAET